MSIVRAVRRQVGASTLLLDSEFPTESQPESDVGAVTRQVGVSTLLLDSDSLTESRPESADGAGSRLATKKLGVASVGKASKRKRGASVSLADERKLAAFGGGALKETQVTAVRGEQKDDPLGSAEETFLSFSCDDSCQDELEATAQACSHEDFHKGPKIQWDAQTVSTSSLTGESTPEEWEAGQEEMFEEMDNIQREQKATKADDAEVPDLLWVSNLVDDGPSEWTALQQTNLDGAMEFARERLLRYWEKTLLRSFWKWMKEQYPALRKAALEGHSGLVKWNPSTRSYSWQEAGKEKKALGGIVQ
jgi:hypothetical protein